MRMDANFASTPIPAKQRNFRVRACSKKLLETRIFLRQEVIGDSLLVASRCTYHSKCKRSVLGGGGNGLKGPFHISNRIFMVCLSEM